MNEPYIPGLVMEQDEELAQLIEMRDQRKEELRNDPDLVALEEAVLLRKDEIMNGTTYEEIVGEDPTQVS